ncbi:hypothetical protein ACE01N_19835 [Saccharicrinis sp. FJH2]|uniref:hypothetical protein n=1 Tax=Saccharicrinis sp. FJH65 TaxID=3344659 RepID=UPI0035F4D86D
MKALKTIFLGLFIHISIIGYGKQGNPKDLGIGMIFAIDAFELLENGIPQNLFYSDINFKNNITNPEFIKPFLDKPDYALFHFICLERHTKYYKILINDTLEAFVESGKGFKYLTWEEVIKESLGFIRLNRDENPIHIDSNSESDTIDYTCDADDFRAVDFKTIDNEFWVKIEFSNTCKSDCAEIYDKKNGWIRWREDKKLLIKMFFLC